LPTLTQDPRPRNRVKAARDQSSSKNLVNSGSRNTWWWLCGTKELSFGAI